MGILHLFFGLSGRINRGKYWLTLVIWLVIWTVAIVAFVLGGLAIFDRNLKEGSLPSPEDFDAFWRMVRDYGALSLIILVFMIVSWVSALAIGIKRLHDREGVVDRFVLLRACGSPSCATLRGKRNARVNAPRARRVCGFYLEPGGARIPARDARSQSVWCRSVDARSCASSVRHARERPLQAFWISL